MVHTSTMATSLNISSSTTIPSLALPVLEKITNSNYLLWHAQIMSAIRAMQLEGFLDGSEKKPSKIVQDTIGDSVVDESNPTYVYRVARDQSVLGYLIASLTR
jgi:hypothetical protein